MITAIVSLVSAIGVVAGARSLKARGLAQIRWWATPAICLFGLIGLPMTISVILYPSLCKAAGGVYLAPWITELWRGYGHLLGLGWMVAVVVVYFGRGIHYTCPIRQRLLLLVPIVLLCLSSLLDTVTFYLLRDANPARIVVKSISPDGTRRILCEEYNWLDTYYEFVVTANVNRPLTCMRLHGPFFDDDPDGERRISWSTDSQIMCLWVGNNPVCLYDFARSEYDEPDLSWGNDKKREEAEAEGRAAFAEKMSAIFSEHGGVAQEIENAEQEPAADATRR